MKKPDFVKCSDCEHFWWYAGRCTAYDEPEFDENIGADDEEWWSTFCPEGIKWCTLFELKHTQEMDFEWYDPLPDPEIIKKVKELYINMCDGTLKRRLKAYESI